MAKPSRRHHFVPQFLLGGFTDSGDKQGAFWVFDLQNPNDPRGSTPLNEACQRDFYRIDVPCIEQDSIERLLSRMETEAAPVISRILQDRDLPQGGDFSLLACFVAALALRTHRFRNKLTTYNQLDAKRHLRSKVATREEWEKTLARMPEEGTAESIDASYEQMKRFVEKDDYHVRVPKERLMLDFLNILQPFADELSKLNWSLVIARDGVGHFICSDNPVSIYPTVEIPSRPSGSWLQCRPQIMMPLNTHLAVFISDQCLPAVLSADCWKVAELNTNTADMARRYVYSFSPNFAWRRDNGTIGSSYEYMVTRDSRLALATRTISIEEAFFTDA